jgi:hypothetical protein
MGRPRCPTAVLEKEARVPPHKMYQSEEFPLRKGFYATAFWATLVRVAFSIHYNIIEHYTYNL